MSRGNGERAALIGILVDVSASMTKSIGAISGGSVTRLDGVRSSIRELAHQLAEGIPESAEDAASSIDIFVLGFGFGNPISSFLRGGGPAVRDLLRSGACGNGIVTASELSKNWARYESDIRSMAIEMFGATPLKAAMTTAEQRFDNEMKSGEYKWGSWLLIISDGAPTDGAPDEIGAIADRMRKKGIMIASCFVAGNDIVSHRRIYCKPERDWSLEATLMFRCASILPNESQIRSYFVEIGWTVDKEGRLFSQANNSKLISELVGALSRITGEQAHVPKAPSKSISISNERDGFDVFLSYAREDRDKAETLATVLINAGVSVWWDRELLSGDRFDELIRAKLDAAGAVIVLWSENSISSDWVKFEASRAHEQNKLIPVRSKELDPSKIPPPYVAVLHTIMLEDQAALLASLRRRVVSTK